MAFNMMEISPIFKVPGLFLATAAIHFSLTPPNAINASPEEGAFIPSIWERILRVLFRTIVFCKVCFWLTALAESVVIIARAYPSLSISKHILQNLLFHDHGDDIYFTGASLLGIFLTVSGAGLRAWCYRILGKHFTFVITMKEDHSLATTGPYGVVRHPSYSGMSMAIIGVTLLHATTGSWVRESGILRMPLGGFLFTNLAAFMLLAVISLLARMRDEDEALRQRFREQWDAWAIKVPYLLIPGII